MAATKLTDRGVTAAKAPEGGRVDFWDSEMRGLMLRVSGRSRVWYYRYRRPDKSQPRVRLGHYVPPEHAAGDPTALTVAGARAKARRLRTQVDDGKDPASEKAATRAEARAQPIKTVGDLAAEYLRACEKGRYKGKTKRASTLAAEAWLWKKHGEPHLGDIRLEAVSVAAIKRPLHLLADDGKGVTANRTRALLHRVFAYGVKEGRIASNPVSTIDPIAEETARERVLTDPEIKALWAALVDTTGLRVPTSETEGKPLRVGRPVRIALQLCLLLAQRRGEVASMNLADIDFDRRLWVVPAAVAKNGKANPVPLCQTAIDLVREAMALRIPPDSPWVFPGRAHAVDAPIAASALTHAWRDIRAAVGVSNATVHDLRRTAASLMGGDRVGTDPHIVALVLNHLTARGASSVTFIYLRSDRLADRTRALAGLERVLLEIVAERDPDAKVVPFAGGAA